MENKHLQLLRRIQKYQSLDAALEAMSSENLREGEPFIGYYSENGTDHAVIGLGGINGEPKLFFFDGAEIEAKIKEGYDSLLELIEDIYVESSETLYINGAKPE
jgi:hypothetical protein